MHTTDYELLARALRRAKPVANGRLHLDANTAKYVAWNTAIHEVAKALAMENSRFNEALFLDMCNRDPIA